MIDFPLNPTNGLTYSIDDHVWSWNGYAWEKVVQTGGVSAGAGLTLAGSTLGIDPTAVIHVAGISADGGITASGRISTDVFGSETTATFIQMDRGGGGAGTIGFNPGGNFSTLITPTLIYSGGNVEIEGASTLKGLVKANSGISSDVGATFGGDINMLDNQLVRPKFKDYAETVNVIGTVTGNTAISFANGNVQTVTGNGNCEFSFTNEPASGSAGTITLLITNGGANTTTWEAAVKWPGNVAPSLTSSGIDILSFITIDGGTTIYGFVGGINFS